MSSKQATSFRREVIGKVSTPATGYLGSAVVLMHKGMEIVIMAADHETVTQVVRDMRPSLDLDPKAIYPVCLMHDRHVIIEDEL